MPYADALDRVRKVHGMPLARGSVEEQRALDRFKNFFATFAPDKVERLLDQTYAPDVWFNDTLKEIEGRAPLGEYLRHSAQAVDACTVQVHEVLGNDQGDYFLRWTMMIRFKRFKRGESTYSIGISHIRFDGNGLVVLHQDYWNAADGLFQHIPLIGALIRAIKKRV